MSRSFPLLLVAALSLVAVACPEPVGSPQPAPRPPVAEADELLACPDGNMTAICNSQNSLTHVYNEHCTNQAGKSEWGQAYCQNSVHLVNACNEATTHPAASDGNNCFARGEDGEIVGTTSNGTDTNCFKVVFSTTGFGQVTMTTMYPVADNNC